MVSRENSRLTLGWPGFGWVWSWASTESHGQYGPVGSNRLYLRFSASGTGLVRSLSLLREFSTLSVDLLICCLGLVWATGPNSNRECHEGTRYLNTTHAFRVLCTFTLRSSVSDLGQSHTLLDDKILIR